MIIVQHNDIVTIQPCEIVKVRVLSIFNVISHNDIERCYGISAHNNSWVNQFDFTAQFCAIILCILQNIVFLGVFRSVTFLHIDNGNLAELLISKIVHSHFISKRA